MTKSLLRPLAELCSAIETTDPKRDPEREFLYVDISAIDNEKKLISTPQRVAGKTASVRARQVVQAKDVLVATTRPNLNAVALVPEQYNGEICSTGFCVLRANEELNPDFLFCFVRSPAFVAPLVALTKGGLYPAVTDRQVLAQRIPWVPLVEQRKVAYRLQAQLAEVDAARQAARAQLSDIRLLRNRMLKSFFAELGDAPKRKLGDYAVTTSGSTPPRGVKHYWSPAEVAWVKTGEVAFAPITATEEAVSKRALEECSLSLLPPKTILIAMYGQGKTRGQSAVLEIAATTNQACFAILPNETWEPEFLYLWLKSSYQDLRDMSDGRGGNQANLNGSLLKALSIAAPTKREQQQFVARVQAALIEIDAFENACKTALEDIVRLPGRLLAKAFEA